MNYQIRSIDEAILNKIKMHGAFVVAIHQSTMHLKVLDIILTMGYDIGEGIHHIIINKNINFKSKNITLHSPIKLTNHLLIIEKLNFKIQRNAIKVFKPYRHKYVLYNNLESIKKAIVKLLKVHGNNYYSYDHTNKMLSFKYHQIKHFLELPNIQTISNILGLGEGLTPLGDDIIVGYILGLNTLHLRPKWLDDFIEKLDQQTTVFSKQQMMDTYQFMYSKKIIDFIETIQSNLDPIKINALLDVGQTSGAGIITGFLHAIKSGGHE